MTALIEARADLSSVLPTTQYFEIDSRRVGARFGVWVTLPLRYAREDVDYPVVYQTDGNKAAPTTVPAFGLLRDDPINPIRPFVQVSVGYVGDDVPRRLAVRARDLLPPGDRSPPVPTSRPSTPSRQPGSCRRPTPGSTWRTCATRGPTCSWPSSSMSSTRPCGRASG